MWSQRSVREVVEDRRYLRAAVVTVAADRRYYLTASSLSTSSWLPADPGS